MKQERGMHEERLRTRSSDVSGRHDAEADVANNENVGSYFLVELLLKRGGNGTTEREREMAVEEEWRKNADTHKMSAEEVKAAGVEASRRPPGSGRHPGGTLHQTRALPFSFTTITLTGLFISAAVGYFVLYTHKKPDATASDVAKVAVGVADARDTRPGN